MKRIIWMTALLLSLVPSVFAQSYKTLEHHIVVGAGPSWPGEKGADVQALALSLGYGLDIRLSQHFSLMPHIEGRTLVEGAFEGDMDGADYDSFGMFDFSVSARWHFTTEAFPIVVGIAPYVSYATQRDEFYLDAFPSAGINGKAKIRPWDFGLMPSLTLDVMRHLSFGAKANIGLLDVAASYPAFGPLPTRRLLSVEGVLTFRF